MFARPPRLPVRVRSSLQALAVLLTLLAGPVVAAAPAGSGPEALSRTAAAAPAGPGPGARSGTAAAAPDSAAATPDSAGATPDSAAARADSTRAATPPPPPDYVAMVRANFTPESRAYATTLAALGFIEPVYGILVGLFLLFSGLSARFRDIAHAMGHRIYVRVLVYLVLYLAAGFVLTFPLAFYQGFAIEHRYGLSDQGFSPWLAEQLKQVLVGIAFFGIVPLVRLAYAPIARFPRRWWLVLAAGTLPVMVAGTLLQPVVIDPLFNRFTPLQDPRLSGEIVGLAERAGIPGRRVFQVGRSAQTRKINAYVSGFGVSQRIVLWDTTLRDMREDEILFVMGHEMGHYRLHHIWLGIAGVSLLSAVLFWLCAAIMRRAVRRWAGRWGFVHLHDIASLPLFVATLTLLSLLAQPGVNWFSRHVEREADAFGLELTHANDAAARAFIKLAAQNRLNPDPPQWLKVSEYDHPALVERIRFAESYRPWAAGKPGRYFRAGR
ncbi:MAG: M48 family metallopeptidase [Candidatus Eisenbacteria bacterium]|nr:M48 family metallopeptidase [Candidatus Eisenbacteria bacterium]